MLKTVLAATTALAIAGTSLVYAAPRDKADGAQRWRPSAEDIGAFSDARIAGLKAGLKLTPAQEKNWPAVETALRDLAKTRTDRILARQSTDKDTQATRDPIERLRTQADRMTATGAGLKKLADATAPLYQSLDEGQKQRLLVLARAELRGGNQWQNERGRPGRHGHKHEHRGPRGPQQGAPAAQ